MINIQIFDKNGVELCDGDTIRELSITKWADTDYGDFGSFVVDGGTDIEWREYTYILSEKIEDGLVFLPDENEYTKEDLMDLFHHSDEADWDVEKEDILDCIRDYTTAQDEEGILAEIRGFTIVKRATAQP